MDLLRPADAEGVVGRFETDVEAPLEVKLGAVVANKLTGRLDSRYETYSYLSFEAHANSFRE